MTKAPTVTGDVVTVTRMEATDGPLGDPEIRRRVDVLTHLRDGMIAPADRPRLPAPAPCPGSRSAPAPGPPRLPAPAPCPGSLPDVAHGDTMGAPVTTWAGIAVVLSVDAVAITSGWRSSVAMVRPLPGRVPASVGPVRRMSGGTGLPAGIRSSGATHGRERRAYGRQERHLAGARRGRRRGGRAGAGTRAGWGSAMAEWRDDGPGPSDRMVDRRPDNVTGPSTGRDGPP